MQVCRRFSEKLKTVAVDEAESPKEKSRSFMKFIPKFRFVDEIADL